MKRIQRRTSLLFALLAVWFAYANVMAQPQPVFLRLKAVGVGGNLSGAGSDMQVVGNLAYLAWGGLQIFSLSNATAPVWVGGYASLVHANSIHVVGHHAYLAEWAGQSFTNDAGAFEIIDVSDPVNPVRVGGMNTLGRANAIRVAGNFAYVAESSRWTGSNLLGALEIFNVSTPTNPVRVAAFDTTGSVTSVDVSGNYAFLADGVTDLQVLDVSDPNNPQRVGVYLSNVTHNGCGFEAGGPANFVQVVGNLAYSAGENGLHVLDISDPAHPESIDDSFCFPLQSFQLSGHYACATVWSSQANTYFLVVLDASDPTDLVVVGTKANWNSRVFQVVGNLIYNATNPLSVYEISDRPAIMSLSLTFDSLILTWDFAPGFVLQRADSLATPQWSDVPASEGQTSIQLPMTNGNEFFRLARP